MSTDLRVIEGEGGVESTVLSIRVGGVLYGVDVGVWGLELGLGRGEWDVGRGSEPPFVCVVVDSGVLHVLSGLFSLWDSSYVLAVDEYVCVPVEGLEGVRCRSRVDGLGLELLLGSGRCVEVGVAGELLLDAGRLVSGVLVQCAQGE